MTEPWTIRLIDTIPTLFGRDVTPGVLQYPLPGELSARVASCPRCRRLLVRIRLFGPIGQSLNLDIDPPSHWIVGFWATLTDAEFWSLCKQDFTGIGLGGPHRCVRVNRYKLTKRP